jgi:hypothetical protein
MQTPWAVKCRQHGKVFLNEHEYSAQLMLPDARWKCPFCRRTAEWDDDNYERYLHERDRHE